MWYFTGGGGQSHWFDNNCSDNHCSDVHCSDNHCSDNHCSDNHCSDIRCSDGRIIAPIIIAPTIIAPTLIAPTPKMTYFLFNKCRDMRLNIIIFRKKAFRVTTLYQYSSRCLHSYRTRFFIIDLKPRWAINSVVKRFSLFSLDKRRENVKKYLQ